MVQFAPYLRRVLCKTRLIFLHINGPIVNCWFCNDDVSKNLKSKNVILLFFYDVKTRHFCSCPNSKGDILQKALTFLQLLDIPI